MQTRITLSLNEDEHNALSSLAREECRNPRAQLLFLLRQEARKRGLLPTSADDYKETSTFVSADQESATYATSK